MKTGNSHIWINAVGGVGDTLMLSGVLKRVNETSPLRRFNLVDRTGYRAILDGHPAIDVIGDPPPDAEILRTSYWDAEPLGPGSQRAFQILARMFGLSTPVDETLYLPGHVQQPDRWHDLLPLTQRKVLIGPTSASPRKEMPRPWWEKLVAALRERDVFVAQMGCARDPYVRGCYSLLGLTTVREAIALLPFFDLVVTSDNFLMHAAHLTARPAVVVWGPTDHRVYGYERQTHLQATPCEELTTRCIGPGRAQYYASDCHRNKDHCMTQITTEHALLKCFEVLDQ